MKQTQIQLTPEIYDLVLGLAVEFGIVEPLQPGQWHKNRGRCPVAEGTLVDVKYRDGVEAYNLRAMILEPGTGRDASPQFWRLDGWDNDIVLWRPSMVSGKPYIVEV